MEIVNSLVLTQQQFSAQFAEAQSEYERFHTNVMAIFREANGEADADRIKEAFKKANDQHKYIDQLIAGLAITMTKRTKGLRFEEWTRRQKVDNADNIALREMNSRTMNYLLSVYVPVLQAAQFVEEKRSDDPYAW
jgi:hypothetical protein